MTSEREAYVYVQLPGTMETVPAALLRVKNLVEHLDLQPHPEGGYYRETFRSEQQVPFNGGMRSAATVIYYLLAQGAYSAWHRIDADETWYFHGGRRRYGGGCAAAW